MRVWVAIVAAVLAGGSATFAVAQHRQHHDASAPPARNDREFVRFPPALVEHTLANMRDHLQALHRDLIASRHGPHGHCCQHRRKAAWNVVAGTAQRGLKFPNTCRRECRMPERRCTARRVAFQLPHRKRVLPAIKARAYGTCGNIGSVRGLSRGVQAEIACEIRARASRTRICRRTRDRGRPRLIIGVPM